MIRKIPKMNKPNLPKKGIPVFLINVRIKHSTPTITAAALPVI